LNNALGTIGDIVEGVTHNGADLGILLKGIIGILQCIVGDTANKAVDGILHCVVALLTKITSLVSGVCHTTVSAVNVATSLLSGALLGAVTGLATSLPGLIAQLNTLCAQLNLSS